MRRWALNIAPHKEKYGGDLGTFDAVITMPATNFRNRPTRFTNLMRLLVVFPLLTQAAQTLHGRVVNIADGDTITVLVDNTPHKIRLAGIDAPEKAQSFGQVSKDHLRDLIADKMVDVEYHKKDRYRCVVGKVLLHGRDIDLEQIRGGMAWHYKNYAKEQSANDRALYAAAEDNAREKRIGLWHDDKPTPPWEWRHRVRRGAMESPKGRD